MNKENKEVSGTKEWAKYNENCISGCTHGCRYCYAAAMSIRFKRKTSADWKNESLNERKLEKVFKKKDGRFMFPTTHDITPENLDSCLLFLQNMLKVGNEVLVVSKPHLECIKSICDNMKEYRQQILFRFTIGSTNNDTLRFWEPHAPDFDERLESLRYAFGLEFATSVSCEPMLDDNIDDMIAQLLPFVTDAIWLGKGKSMMNRLKMNGYDDPETIQRTIQLRNLLSESYIHALYERYKNNPKVKWKDTIKKIVGIPISDEAGLDI